MNSNSSLRASRLVLLLAVVGLAAVPLATTGCVAVAAGAGAGAAVAYVRGDLAANLPHAYDRTVDEANQAVKDLQFAKVSEKRDALVCTIVARNADDKKIEIRVENQGKNSTAVKIRVGLFGDEPLSLAVLEKIKANL